MTTINSRSHARDEIEELQHLVDQLMVTVHTQQDHITALEANVAKLTWEVQKIQKTPQFTVNYSGVTQPTFNTKP